MHLFQEFGAGPQMMERLQDDLRNWNNLSLEEKEQKIPNRIENLCSKGRFAQRMVASHQIKKDKVPPYIRAALTFIGLPIDETTPAD